MVSCCSRSTGRPLRIGATFAGLDFVILSGAFAGCWLLRSPRPIKKRIFCVLGTVILLHLCYLIVLCYATQLRDLFQNPANLQQYQNAMPAAPSDYWNRFCYQAIPWNMPLLGGLLHLVIVGTLLRWTTWDTTVAVSNRKACPLFLALFLLIGSGLLILLCAGRTGDPTLQGKKIRFYDRTYVNWMQPAHGRYGNLSGGMCGLIPAYLETMGAEVSVSSDVNERDLADSDLLIVYCPSQAWKTSQLQAIERYVHQGGSLLVIGEHTIRDHDRSNRSNDLLEKTSMDIPFDSAMFAVAGWSDGYHALIHPATQWRTRDPNPYGVSIGASVEVAWPASPILVGCWGWTDYGDLGNRAGKLGNWLYDSGEKLGDLVHVAEQRVGKGRIMVFGDTTPLMNTTVLQTYPFMMRILAYLCGEHAAHAGWRQVLCVLLVIVLLILLIRHRESWTVVLVVIGLAGTLWGQTGLHTQAGTLIPEGDPNDHTVAYIDCAHLPAFNEYLWRPDDLGAFVLTLMRNQCLPFECLTWSPGQLERADFLICVAPAKPYTIEEIEQIHDFVDKGGILIVTVGYEESVPSRSLLSSFGFHVGRDPNHPERDPLPMGHFKAPYLKSGNHLFHVRFHAGWPVYATDPNARVVANGRGNLPVIQQLTQGRGKVIVIGDSGFVMNKNLEREDGQPIEGRHENAVFWRWFFTRLQDQSMWIPPEESSSTPSKPSPRRSVLIDPGVRP